MNFRPIAGIFLFLAVLIVPPASALPDVGFFQPVSDMKTGTVWVMTNPINGSISGESVNIAYAMGNISEINGADVYVDSMSGVVSITMNENDPAGHFTLMPGTSADMRYYAVNSVTVATESAPLLSNHEAFAVIPATSNYYADMVPEGKQHEWVDLDWKDSSKALGLTVYAPDATFGPYQDMADGKKDGRIFLDFACLQNVNAGHWFFKVQNSAPSYTPYSLNTYSA